MTFLSPLAALAAAALTLPILLLLYFLKLRRREMAVGSTLLWRQTLRDMQVNTPFQRLRFSLLLVLQLLILAGLLLAVARPVSRQRATGQARAVLLIDRSASMNATDVQRSRLDEARRVARQLVQDRDAAAAGGWWSLGQTPAGQGGMMVVSFARQAQVIQPFTGDTALLGRAIDAITPSDEPGQLAPALRLIEPYAMEAQTQGGSLLVYVLSDGGVEDGQRLALGGSAEVRFIRLGTPTRADAADPEPRQGVDNLAIVAFSLRRDEQNPQRTQVYTRLANFGPSLVKTHLSLRVEGAAQGVVALSIPPAEPGSQSEPGIQSVQYELELPQGGLIEVSHDHEDVLGADNTVWLVVPPPSGLRVLVVGPGNAFVEQALKAQGVRRLALASPAQYEALATSLVKTGAGQALALPRVSPLTQGESFDALIFDRYAPQALAAIDSLYLGIVPPAPDLALWTARPGAPLSQRVLEWNRDHPILRYVALDDLVLSSPGRLALPREAQILAVGLSGPMLARWQHQGVEHVMVGFDFFESNWWKLVSFPVFMSNVVPWLALGGAQAQGLSYQPGDVAVARVGDIGAATLEYRGPVRLTAVVERDRALLPPLERVGLYTAAGSAVKPPWNRLAVNLLDSRESDVRPIQALTIGTTLAQARDSREVVRREAWPWLIAAAMGMLMLEWLFYARGMKV